MVRTTQEELGRIASALMSGEIESLLDRYAQTVSIFMPGGLYCLADHGDIVSSLVRLLSAARRAGMVNIRGEIAAHGICRNRQVRVFVDWVYDMGPGKRERRSSVVYYWADRGFGPKIEMVEYRSMAFGNVHAWNTEERVTHDKRAAAGGF